MLEAEKIGWGASGRNGGQLINGYSRGYDTIKSSYGEDTARAIVEMSFEGADIIRQRIEKYNIACDLKKSGSVFAAYTEKQMNGLREEKETWERFGHNSLKLLNKRETDTISGSDAYVGGMIDPRGGHIQPLNLCLGQAAAIESLGGLIFEDSKVTKLERTKTPVVHTAGGQVTAKFVILCGNAYLGKTVPELAVKTMPVSSQIITTTPLPDIVANDLLPQDHCLEDCNYVLNYYRKTADRRLLFGGGIVYGGGNPADIKASLRPKMIEVFPHLKDISIDFAWSCTMAFTFRRLPHIGRLTDNIYFLQGYSGHGVTTTHLMGRLVAEAVQGQAERFDVFSSIKHMPFPGGRLFSVPLTALGAFYYQMKEKLGL